MKRSAIILVAMLAMPAYSHAGTRFVVNPHTGKLDAVGGNASDVGYSKSGVSATNVQGALDYLMTNISLLLTSGGIVFTDPILGKRYSLGIVMDPDSNLPTAAWAELSPTTTGQTLDADFVLDQSTLG